MFKFIKQYAETIDGAQVYPMISLLIFFIFFVVLLLYVKTMDKNRIKQISNIPLDQETDQPTTIS
ncbi:MAG TPA: CcoQ/FixQ family Cbb3-type cytochrome c oxidase assembly chaperone [Chitinophagaceae bacterium]|nr:CcoQ/FixQ family Cbb3-type cytochrome c oxidase assembly chaperone [Chitinophagaceae bacterium]HRF27270.1 CcoQ/FixQ family Cbb3-type cytochrome c oxidase assembly chaperone [Ferruginibacter sp.]